MATHVKDTDHGYNDMIKRVFGFGNPTVRVGILSAEGNRKHGSDDLSVLDVAIWNEFGTRTIPARSFVRGWFDSHQTEIRDQLRTLMQDVIRGRSRKEQALDKLGAWMVGQIQKRMSDGIPPPNAPSTIQAKGSSTPLINTGQLRNSVNWKVKL